MQTDAERIDNYLNGAGTLGPFGYLQSLIWIANANKRPYEHAPRWAKKFLGIGRNDNCPCQSGSKFKKCCMNKLVEVAGPQKY